MKAKVTVGGRESDLFDVLGGVKQGCVLAPVIFNLFLVAVTLACRNGLPTNAGIPYTYHWGRAAGYQPSPQAADRGTTFRYEGKLRTKQVLHLTNKQSRTSSGRTWRWLAGGDAYHHEIPTSSMTSLWHGKSEPPQKLTPRCGRA